MGIVEHEQNGVSPPRAAPEAFWPTGPPRVSQPHPVVGNVFLQQRHQEADGQEEHNQLRHDDGKELQAINE